MGNEARPRVQAILPEFSAELADALMADDRPELAAQVFDLTIFGRCSCGDDFCASFYTAPKPGRPWRDFGEHTNIVPNVSTGMVVLDVVDGLIRYVEVLDRPDVKQLVEDLPVVAVPSDSPDDD